MPSTFSSNLRLEKQASGENDTSWGTRINTVIDLIEEALTSMETISTTTGTVTLSTSNSVSDQSRKSSIKLTGALTANLIIVVPNLNKHYLIWNATTNAFTVTVKTSAGTGIAVTQGTKQFVYCDATNVVDTLTLTSFGVTATATELNYVAGVSSAIQTQLNGKLATSGGTDLAVADGGTGASTAADARTNLGAAALGVIAGTARQTDQAVTATTRAATTTLGTSLNHTLSDTSTTITAFNGVAGVTYSCRALGAGSITHHATNLIITQGSADLTTAAGMTFDVEMITSTTSRIKNVMKADGTAIVASEPVRSYVRLNTANGYGSTNTAIRRFTNTVNSSGSDITYADSATLGATFTLNTTGVYTINFCDQFNAASTLGASINSAQLTTAITSITVANVICMGTSAQADFVTPSSATFFATAGDVVRAHTNGLASGTSVTGCQFTIARVA